MIREAIIKLANKEDIGFEMAEAVMNEIMSGKASEVQKSAYLTALSMKGETIDEITASAKEMRRHCVRFLNDQDVLEIVGTGGDRSNSFKKGRRDPPEDRDHLPFCTELPHFHEVCGAGQKGARYPHGL